MNEKKSAKSLFLYTALIFLVALLMIILSFFGQNHAEQLRETEKKAQTITERASILSEENLKLTEKVSTLTKDKESLETQLAEEKGNSAVLTEKINSIEATMSAYAAFKSKKKNEAAETIKIVNPDLLSPQFREMYDEVAEAVIEKE